MAKALMGHVTNERTYHLGRWSSTNSRLRRRVGDLETMVLRLQAENDRLSARGCSRRRPAVENLQPV